jgi:hypothetical protein
MYPNSLEIQRTPLRGICGESQVSQIISHSMQDDWTDLNSADHSTGCRPVFAHRLLYHQSQQLIMDVERIAETAQVMASYGAKRRRGKE